MSLLRAQTEGPHARSLVRTARLVSAVLAALGMLSLLRTGVSGIGDGTTHDLFVFPTHPVTGLVWIVLGIAGIALAERPGRARAYLAVTGALLLLWAVVALAGGADDGPFVRDEAIVLLHLVLGAVAIAVVVNPLARQASARPAAAEEETSP
ncbi:MAG: DUF4383 domain-containing protein [Thermoleophilia bacterium]